MKKNLFVLFSALLVASMVLSACAAPAAPSVTVNQTTNVTVQSAPAQSAAVVYFPTAEPTALAASKAAEQYQIPTAMPATISTQVPFAQAATCASIPAANPVTDYVEFNLNPNESVAGDFEALVNNAWVYLHDDGIGQFEIYRNIGTEVVHMRGHWGGGCLLTVDVKTLVNGEFQNPNHTDFVRVHLVTFSTANQYVEQMYEKANLPLK